MTALAVFVEQKRQIGKEMNWLSEIVRILQDVCVLRCVSSLD